MRILCAVLPALFLVATDAYACSPPIPIPEQHARAESVQLGYVVGERWPDEERRLLAGDTKWHMSNHRLVRVVFVEALKGKLSLPREVLVPCAMPVPELHQRAFVVSSQGLDFLVPADYPDYEQSLRAALKAGR
jgi:hypothetical protein